MRNIHVDDDDRPDESAFEDASIELDSDFARDLADEVKVMAKPPLVRDLPIISDPIISERYAVEFNTVESNAVEPTKVESNTAKPNTIKPGVTEPDALKPDALEPNALVTTAIESNTLEPNTTVPAVSEPLTSEDKESCRRNNCHRRKHRHQTVRDEMIESKMSDDMLIESHLLDVNCLELLQIVELCTSSCTAHESMTDMTFPGEGKVSREGTLRSKSCRDVLGAVRIQKKVSWAGVDGAGQTHNDLNQAKNYIFDDDRRSEC